MTGSQVIDAEEDRHKLVVEYKDALQPADFYHNFKQRGIRSVQLSLVDLKLPEAAEIYGRYCRGECLSLHQRQLIAPTRQDVVQLFTYIRSGLTAGLMRCRREELEQGLLRCCPEYSLRRIDPCLDILRELGVVQLQRTGELLCLSLPAGVHNPLENSQLYQALRGD